MRFIKEVIVIIFIIVFLIGTEFITTKVTKDSMISIDRKVDKIKDILKSDDYDTENALEKIEELDNEWKDVEIKMSYFAEHDELEKVSINLNMIKSNIEMEDTENAYEKIGEIKFLLEHIKNKQKIKLNNIF